MSARAPSEVVRGHSEAGEGALFTQNLCDEAANFKPSEKRRRGMRTLRMRTLRMNSTSMPLDSDIGWFRNCLLTLTGNAAYKSSMALIIIFNSVLLIVETDMRASQRTSYWESTRDVAGFSFVPPSWLAWLSNIFVLVYMLDLASRLVAEHKAFFHTAANQFDMVIVTIDFLVLVLEPLQDLPSVAVLRMARMLRIVRVLRNFLVLRELYLMMQGLVSAIRSIIFATLLITVVLILWSIMAVEFVHLPNIELFENFEYGECLMCRDSFSSVFRSALTFLRGIIAGDSWGVQAIPLMLHYPETAFVLLGSLLMVQLGLLNLIVAVIVDRAAVARENDEELKFTEKQECMDASYKRLEDLFSRIDIEGDGTLTLRQLQERYETHPEFREVLDLMDIRHRDLNVLYEILDKDGDNEVTFQEFVEQLHEVKTMNSHTALIYIKHFAEMVNVTVKDLLQRSDAHCALLKQMHKHLMGEDVDLNGRADGSAWGNTDYWQRSMMAEALTKSSVVTEAPPWAMRPPMMANARHAEQLATTAGSIAASFAASVAQFEALEHTQETRARPEKDSCRAVFNAVDARIKVGEQRLPESSRLLRSTAVAPSSDALLKDPVAGLPDMLRETAVSQQILKEFMQAGTVPIERPGCCASCTSEPCTGV